VGIGRRSDEEWERGDLKRRVPTDCSFVGRRRVWLFDEAAGESSGEAVMGRGSVSDVGELGRSFVGCHLTIGSSDRGAASSVSQGGGR